ncbi:MAG: tRNA preQ1(34) S-adenosylmethionine ribosyltransferase-isomerase QueA [candidate division Zixibacteria bacterium]|nr:tRNA preQ1(34) S-adenosylmethionine ribosyltransferase-isomerase QueA [candidate division Zixibacteria bacterium]
MDVALFDYHLPQELIAQFPVRNRDRSRLLVFDRKTDVIEHAGFRDITAYLKKGDVLVVNNTRVFKARLWGKRATGARVEVFLVRKSDKSPETWQALVSPSKRVKEGEEIYFDKYRLSLDKYNGQGSWEIRFSSKSVRERIIAGFGRVPLPHYIRRDNQPLDIRRYQTLFAAKDKIGAVAAPTAGFHFTRSIMAEIQKRGVQIVQLTLHVGPGTFKPIKTDNIDEHIVDPEYAELSSNTAVKINKALKAGGRIFAVGTTSVRTLESAEMVDGHIRPFSGMVDLYIKPGYKFKIVEHLITNFHLPKSSLLVLVSAFADREKILAAYREAIKYKYRFYSYGDAMLIL